MTDTAIDVVFDLAGTTLPADHAVALREAIATRLPWLRDAGPAVGIHPLRANATDYGVVLLAQRAKLVLRVPQARLDDALRLGSRPLDVAGTRLTVGEGRPRPLRASATLAASAVTFGAAELAPFEQSVAEALAAIGVEGEFIAGRRRSARAGERTIAGFSLTLHGLGADASLCVQTLGLGDERALGWGLFVPAKAISTSA